jgi:hypothetical protein
VKLLRSAMLVFRLTCSQVLVDFLGCIDANAARGWLLPSAVFIGVEDMNML